MKEIPFIPVEIFIEKIIKSYWKNYDVNCIHVFINKKKERKVFYNRCFFANDNQWLRQTFVKNTYGGDISECDK